MPFKDKKKEKAYRAKYYQENKERMDALTKKWKEDHPEYMLRQLETAKKYGKTAKGKRANKKKQRKYNKSEKGKLNQRKVNQSTKGKHRAYIVRIRKYDLTEDEHKRMINEQEGKCAICNKYGGKDLHIDHDHQTGKARGLLCKSCNYSLGFANDDVDILLSAIQYLRKSRELKTSTFITPA